jgi:hypothetical protein
MVSKVPDVSVTVVLIVVGLKESTTVFVTAVEAVSLEL